MNEIFYDWGGANVWLFHAINDIRFERLDHVMLFGTYLEGHTFLLPASITDGLRPFSGLPFNFN